MEIYKNAILIFFLWSLTTICGSLLRIQLELVKFDILVHRPFIRFSSCLIRYFHHFQEHAVNPVILFSLLCLMFWSFSLIFFYCEFGENISGQFDELIDVIYQFKWYSYPVKMQRMIPIILKGTQHPIVLRGFGNVMCKRFMFKQVKQTENAYFPKRFSISTNFQVVNAGFSYFMVLREFRT